MVCPGDERPFFEAVGGLGVLGVEAEGDGGGNEKQEVADGLTGAMRKLSREWRWTREFS